MIVNCSASDETTGKSVTGGAFISVRSARLLCGYIYANAGEGESTQDLVFGGRILLLRTVPCWQNQRRLKNETVYADMNWSAWNVSAEE